MQNNKNTRKLTNGFSEQFPKTQKVLIPVELIQFCFLNKLINQLKVYCTLKLFCNGKLELSSHNMELLGEYAQIKDKRTTKKHLQWLIENHWCCIDKTNNILFIKSWRHLYRVLSLRSKTSVRYLPGYVLFFRAWCAGVLIARNLQTMKSKAWLRRQKKAWSLSKAASASDFQYIGLSNYSIAKILGVSKTVAIELKKDCKQLGMLKIDKKYGFISGDPDLIKYKHHYFKYDCAPIGSLKAHNGKLWQQKKDEMEHFVKFKKRRNCKKATLI